MKTWLLLSLIAGSSLWTACEVMVAERRPTVTTRRYIRYSDREPYYRVYYRDTTGRPYYRRYYYEDDPVYRTRIDTRRYYYSPGPIDRTYGF